ncbi:MAG: pirin family protein [Bacteroidota bacterium]
MAIKILKPEERGLMENHVFKGHALFSNGMPGTPRPDAFGAVYVFNDDVLYPESFLGMHPHKNVEIVTIMISGTESHKDMLGIHENYTAGDVQLISSGKGLYHQGGNVSSVEPARHLQIWIAPKTLNSKPRVMVKKTGSGQNGLSLLVSPDAAQESLGINQDAWIYNGKLELNQKTNYQVQLPGNAVLVYLVNGIVEINSIPVLEGSTVFLTDENFIELKSRNEDSKFVLIETMV